MAIVVRHTPVGLLTRLAVESGQARRRDIEAQRGMQMQQMAMAAQERAADRAERREAGYQAQAFAIQRAGAAQIARQRPAPVTAEARESRDQLYEAVAGAKSAGIYRPEQIKQMQIFADLGDKTGVRSVLGDLPSPTSRQRELTRQTGVVERGAQGAIAPLQGQISEIDQQLEQQYDAEGLRYIQENPQWMPENIKGLLERRQQLQEQAGQIQQQTDQAKQMLNLGISLPEQMEARAKQEQQAVKMIMSEHKRQTAAAAGITPRQRLMIDVARDKRGDERRGIRKDLAAIDAGMLPFLDNEGQPTESPQEYRERTEPDRLRKQDLLNWITKSENTEKIEIEAILNPERIKTGAKQKYEIGKIYRGASGKRGKFLGTNEQGQNQFQEID